MDGTDGSVRVDKTKREPNRASMSISHAPSSRWSNEAVITKVDNGFIVRIGCKTLIGRDWDEVSNGLDLYWVDPEAAEKLYLKK